MGHVGLTFVFVFDFWFEFCFSHISYTDSKKSQYKDSNPIADINLMWSTPTSLHNTTHYIVLHTMDFKTRSAIWRSWKNIVLRLSPLNTTMELSPPFSSLLLPHRPRFAIQPMSLNALKSTSHMNSDVSKESRRHWSYHSPFKALRKREQRIPITWHEPCPIVLILPFSCSSLSWQH